MGSYADFWTVTDEALHFAHKCSWLRLTPEQ